MFLERLANCATGGIASRHIDQVDPRSSATNLGPNGMSFMTARLHWELWTRRRAMQWAVRAE
jgi:hypothetical protein